MGGRPCIRGLRVTVGTIVGLLAAGHDADEVLAAYPYLERDDISQALAYAAWRAEEQEVTVGSSAPPSAASLSFQAEFGEAYSTTLPRE